MQTLASEMNLSETAFLIPEGGQANWRLRWFTRPLRWTSAVMPPWLAPGAFERQPELRTGALTFQTRSGELRAHWVDGAVELDFPAMTPEPLEIESDVSDIGISAGCCGL